MSNIPVARKMLRALLKYEELPHFARHVIAYTLPLLDREKPEFKVHHDCDPVTREQAEDMLKMRELGMSLRAISAATSQNMARVSEVINGKRRGI